MSASRDRFDALATQHKDAVYRLLLRLCHNEADAEDMLVEALLKAYQHSHELRHPEAFQIWLSQIAKRIYWHDRRRDAGPGIARGHDHVGPLLAGLGGPVGAQPCHLDDR